MSCVCSHLLRASIIGVRSMSAISKAVETDPNWSRSWVPGNLAFWWLLVNAKTMHNSLLLSCRRVSELKCYWAHEGEELRHALVRTCSMWSFGFMLKVNCIRVGFYAPLWYFEGSWWKDTLSLTLLVPWEVAQFAWHLCSKGFFLLSPKSSCKKLFCRWKKVHVFLFQPLTLQNLTLS